MHKTDADLISRCLRGEPSSFRPIYDRYAGMVYRFLRSRIKDRQQALDLSQETFFQAYGQLDKFDLAREFRPWLLGIARYVALNSNRRKSRFAPLPFPLDEFPGSTGDPVHALVVKEQALMLQALIADLPDDEREVFHLRTFEEFTFEEVAQTIGFSVRTAKSRMAAAKSALARSLARARKTP